MLDVHFVPSMWFLGQVVIPLLMQETLEYQSGNVIDYPILCRLPSEIYIKFILQ